MRKNSNAIPLLLEQQVAKIPDSIAIIHHEHTLTYEAFNKKVNQVAHFLLEQGIKPEAPVALCMERSPSMLITLFGILKAGGAYIPCDTHSPDERLLHILQHTSLLIIDKKFKKKFKRFPGEIIVFDEVEWSRYSEDNPKIILTINNLAYIIYTSGSTGQPKGVLIEHKSVINYGQWFEKYCNLTPGQRIDFSGNYAFDLTVSNSLISFLTGLTVVIADDKIKEDPRQYLEFLHNNKITLIKMTPSYLKILLYEIKNNPIELPYLKTIILGGEALHTADSAAWVASYPHHSLINEYGPTETTVAVSIYKFSNSNQYATRLDVPIGKPGPNIKFYLLNKQMTQVPRGEIGELYIGGVCLARGYLNQPTLTAERFIPNPFSKKYKRLYKTGDLCRELSNGVLEYLGRIDHQVKIRGYRIELREIELCLTKHPAIFDAVVLAIKNTLNENQLVAYYILKDNYELPSVEQLRQFLKNYLPDYMIPLAFMKVAFFPLNFNGKLNRDALPSVQFSQTVFSPPTTELERILAEIWTQELGVSSIGVEDNLFELGGHSLIAARIVTHVKSFLKKQLSLQTLYQAPTIKKLAQALDEASHNHEQDNDNTIENCRLLPLSDFQFMFWIANLFAPSAKKINVVARRRLNGRLNYDILALAANNLLKKHEILSYKVLKFLPAQVFQNNLSLKIEEKNLENFQTILAEEILTSSERELLDYYPWPTKKTLLIIRLFHLKNEASEIQIGLPHMIADAASADVVFSELSAFYLNLSQKIYTNDSPVAAYKNFTLKEIKYFKTHFNKDYIFWRDYLKNASFFRFPHNMIINRQVEKNFSYSTYYPLEDDQLIQMHKVCSEHAISISALLSAVVGKVLINYCANSQKNKPIFINVVKSARDNPLYDNAIGCFLRVEPFKIILDEKANIIQFSHKIQQEIITASPYQKASGIVKLSSLNVYRKPNKIIKFLLKIFMHTYAKLFPSLNLNKKILTQCVRMGSFQKEQGFMININVWNNFIINKNKKNNTLFGLKTYPLKLIQDDLLDVDYVLDICFIRDDNQKPYVVISSNLQSSFKEKLAQEIAHVIEHEVLIKKELV